MIAPPEPSLSATGSCWASFAEAIVRFTAGLIGHWALGRLPAQGG